MEPSTPETKDAESLEENATIDATSSGGFGSDNSESLDGSSTSVSLSGSSSSPTPDSNPNSGSKPKGLKGILRRVNIYMLMFVLVVIIAVMALFIGLQRSKKAATPTEISTQTLSTDAINQLSGNDVKIGDAKQTLSVESNAVFAGKVLVQGGVDIAGALKVGGTLSLATLTVSGTGSFQQAQVSELAVSGNAGIAGQLAIQKSLNVTGGGSFGGAVTIPQLTVSSLNLSNDLQLGRHIDAGGNTPSHANGTSIGGGGTSSSSGTDTAGTVVASTGSGPSAGCLVTVTFSQKFNAVPHVVITPASSDAADLSYYVTRTTTSFSVCANNPQASKNYTFDYIVID